jgi:hypothetical protein
VFTLSNLFSSNVYNFVCPPPSFPFHSRHLQTPTTRAKVCWE